MGGSVFAVIMLTLQRRAEMRLKRQLDEEEGDYVDSEYDDEDDYEDVRLLP